MPLDGAVLLKPYANEWLGQFRYESGTYGSKKSFVRSGQEGTPLDRKIFSSECEQCFSNPPCLATNEDLRRWPVSLNAVKCMIVSLKKLFHGSWIKKRTTWNWVNNCGRSYNCNSWSTCKLITCYYKWPLNNMSTEHFLGNRTQIFRKIL